MNILVAMLGLFSAIGAGQDMKEQQELHQWVFDIRNPQTDAKTFNKCLIKIGEVLAHEVLEDLKAKRADVETLTSSESHNGICDEIPVLIAISQRELPLFQGVQEVFPSAKVGFLGMSQKAGIQELKKGCVAIPDVKGKTVILVDTILAPGCSLLDAIQLIERLEPKKIIVVCAIAAQAEIERIINYSDSIEMYPAAIEPTLIDKSYIVSGLADAGDRFYDR
jgi:uracil phosphoribosyltransferase